MAFDLNTFLSKVKTTASAVGTKVAETIRINTPEAWSEEKQYINAIVASMALIVYADGIVENEEVEAVIDTINNETVFKEFNATKEALEHYSIHIQNLTQALMKSKAEYALAVAKISTDISRVKKQEWKENIVNLCMKLAAADGDMANDELIMLNKIKISLNM